jgi:hypothetical protein
MKGLHHKPASIACWMLLATGCTREPGFTPVPSNYIHSCDFRPLWTSGARSLGMCNPGVYLLRVQSAEHEQLFRLNTYSTRAFVDGTTLRIYDDRHAMRPGWYAVNIDRRSWWTQTWSGTSGSGWHLVEQIPEGAPPTLALQPGIYKLNGNHLNLISSPESSCDPLDFIPSSGIYFIASPGYGLIYSANLANVY